MEPPAGGTPTEMAYRAGMVDSRLDSLETHAAVVNGTIKATGDALNALTLSVNGLGLTIKIRGDLLLEIRALTARVTALEAEESSTQSVRAYQRWLLGMGLAMLAAVTTLVATLTHAVH